MEGEPTTFWAKHEWTDEGTRRWHPLLAHSADVAAVFEALVGRTVLRRRLARLLGWDDLDEAHVARLSVLAALHDAGKTNHGFQRRIFDHGGRTAGHVREMLSLLGEPGYSTELLEALNIPELGRWFEVGANRRAFADVLSATWAHHGCPIGPDDERTGFDERLWEPNDERNPLEGLCEHAEAVRRWFPEAFESSARPFPDTKAFRHAFNGVLNLADWLGSNTEFFEFADDIDGRMEFARRRAGELVGDMCLDPQDCRAILGEESISFEDFAPFDTPHDIQQACLDLPVDEQGSLTVLESDTGSGKTEAALARFFRLFDAGFVDGMYFAVPTRAAAKQLHERVQAAMHRMFGDEPLPTVLAVPGYIRVDELDGDPYALPGYEVQWPDEEKMAERGWAAEDSRRYLAAPVAVGTIDQVLMSALEIPHSHLRAAGLLRQFLVVDEIHSSDPYMHRILQEVLDHHLQAGGHALLMSATLSTKDRVSYAESRRAAPPSVEESVENPYPLLTYRGSSAETPEEIHAASSDYRKEVYPKLRREADAADAVADRAVDYARQGARVLVIRNLVDDCVATQRALEERVDDASMIFGPDGVPSPHHSRFAAGDRQRLDKEIEEVFGKETDESGIVAVATQTVEQSLDIDADILMTDLAPADVLLQRIGRLQRHEKRQRPDGFESARVDVLVPQSRQLGEAIVKGGEQSGSGLEGDHGLGTVYSDLRVLEATWRQIEEDDQWVIPDDNRRIVERTTHPNRLKAIVDELGDPWDIHHEYIWGARLGKKSHGDLVTVDRSDHFKEAGALKDADQIKTRLGNDNWTVEFEEPQPGPFGDEVSTLTIPDHWVGEFDSEEDALTAQVVDVGSERLEFEAAGQRFVYDRLGLRRSDDH